MGEKNSTEICAVFQAMRYLPVRSVSGFYLLQGFAGNGFNLRTFAFDPARRAGYAGIAERGLRTLGGGLNLHEPCGCHVDLKRFSGHWHGGWRRIRR